MWVENLSNGKFKFVERYTDYITGKQKKVSVTLDKNTASSRKLAIEMLNKKIQDKIPITNDKLTLDGLIQKYLDHQHKTVKLSTYERNYNSMQTIKKMFGSDVLVERLSSPYINNTFLSSGKSPTALNELLRRFKALLRWGYKNDYIDNINYLDKIDSFKEPTKKEKIKDKYLETDEVNSLLAAIENEEQYHWFYLTKFLLLTGLRIGEAIALTNKDIHMNTKTIDVHKTFNPNTKLTTTPKTQCSIREVFIQDELLSCMIKISIYFNEIKSMNDVCNDFVFTGRNGCQVSYEAYSKYLRTISKKVLKRKISVHTLRHTHASLLLAEGVHIETISRRLGHENSKITKEIYLHVTKKLKNLDNERIRNINIF